MCPLYKPLYFYLENGTDKIDRLEITKLAVFAVKLLPLDKVTSVNDYFVFLDNYMNQNKSCELYNCYFLLRNDKIGKELLSLNIERCFFEKKFREEKVTDDLIIKFSEFQNNYERFLIDNSHAFGNDVSKRR